MSSSVQGKKKQAANGYIEVCQLSLGQFKKQVLQLVTYDDDNMTKLNINVCVERLCDKRLVMLSELKRIQRTGVRINESI